MPVQVIFFTPQGVGRTNTVQGVGSIRRREAVTIPGETTGTVQNGESVVVYNGETGGVLVAHGSTPLATTTTETAASSAGFPVPASMNSVPIEPATGSKIHIAAIP